MGVNYNPKIVTDGLILCLDAANRRSYPGTGNTWFGLVRGNNVTLQNGPTFDANNGGNIVFNGSSNYLTGNTLPTGISPFTMCFWLNFTSAISSDFGSDYGTVLFSGNQANTYELVVTTENVTIGPPYKLVLQKYDGAITGECKVIDIDMPIQRYHNLVVMRDGDDSQKIYLNGKLVATGNISSAFGTGTLHIGGAPAAASYDGYLNGKIAIVQQYNRALTPTEVQQNFDAFRGRFGLDLPVPPPEPPYQLPVLYLDAANNSSYSGSGSTWIDLSANTNDATLVNTPTYNAASFGGEIYFNGQIDNEYATVANSASLIFDNRFSVSVFVSIDSANASYQGVIGKTTSGSWNDGWGLYEDGDNMYFFVNSWNTYEANTTIDGLGVANYTGTFDGDTVKLYKNGTLVGSKSAPNLVNSNAPMDIMRLTDSYNAKGGLHIVQVWRKALSDAEVTSNFDTFKGRFGL